MMIRTLVALLLFPSCMLAQNIHSENLSSSDTTQSHPKSYRIIKATPEMLKGIGDEKSRTPVNSNQQDSIVPPKKEDE